MKSIRNIIQRNVDRVRLRMAAAAERSGRTADAVELIAVTKYVDAEIVNELAAAGLKIFGESRPQVLWEKHDALADRGYDWHLIGHLQRNKVRRTLPIASMIHSVDSLRLLQEIAHESNAQQLVSELLLEVNISSDASKHGLAEHEIRELFDFSLASDSINVCGLMGMGGLASDEAETRRQFASLRELRDRLATEYANQPISLEHLSIGMSRDFEWAIEEGATLVRIGSILYEGIR